MDMKRILIFAMAAMAVAACRKPDDRVEVQPSQVRIEPVITRATEVNFEAGDRIGLTMAKANDTAPYAVNECLTFDGDVFSGDLLWYTDAYSESDIYAYYPYDAAGTPTKFSVETDQTAGIGGSDLMAASKTGVLPTANSVAMVFRHQMTKIVIKIDNQGGEELKDVILRNSIPTADVDIAGLSVTADPSAAAEDIRAFAVSPGSEYAAIIVPQKAALTLVVNSENAVMSQPMASMELKPGGQYTIDVRIISGNLIVKASGEIENWTDEGDIDFDGEGSVDDKPVDFVEHEGYFVYDGVEYETVTLADGNTWMAENLRFVPRGKTVSSDPAEDAGIWYPAANAEKKADPASAETLGLLYDAATAFGADELTVENVSSFEGAQGICPPGWHIPTAAEMTGLVGHCSDASLINTEAPYYDAEIKGAGIAALRDAGWGWTFAGIRNKANTAGKGSYTVTSYEGVYGALSYVLGSTFHKTTLNDDGSIKNVQYYYMMSTYNATNEKITVAYGNFLSGASVRCVKDRN